MSSDQFEFKVMQKNVATEETAQQQNIMLADVRTSFRGIRYGIRNLETLINELCVMLMIVREKVDETKNNMSTLEKSIQNHLNRMVEAELREALMEGTISNEQTDFVYDNINISTLSEVCKLHNQLDVCESGFAGIKQEINIAQNSMKKLKNVLQEVKEYVVLAREKLSTHSNRIQEQLDQLVVDEITEATLEETMSVEDLDSEDMLKNAATKEMIQQRKGVLVYILNDFDDIRKNITDFQDFFETSAKLLLNMEGKISEDEKKLSTFPDGFDKLLDQ